MLTLVLLSDKNAHLESLIYGNIRIINVSTDDDDVYMKRHVDDDVVVKYYHSRRFFC